MKTIDNVNQILCDELRRTLKTGAKVSIVADSFSIFAYQQLRKWLDRAETVRFIFTLPTFIEANAEPKADQFAIMRRQREQALCNSEYEIRPRNTLTQRELACACAQWGTAKVRFKANITSKRMPAFIIVDETVFYGINGFTCTDLGCERGNEMFYNIQILDKNEGASLIAIFEQLWNDAAHIFDVTSTVLEKISTIFRDNDPDFIYFISIYHIFNEFIQSLDAHSAAHNDFQTMAKYAIITSHPKIFSQNCAIRANPCNLTTRPTAHSTIYRTFPICYPAPFSRLSTSTAILTSTHSYMAAPSVLPTIPPPMISSLSPLSSSRRAHKCWIFRPTPPSTAPCPKRRYSPRLPIDSRRNSAATSTKTSAV